MAPCLQNLIWSAGAFYYASADLLGGQHALLPLFRLLQKVVYLRVRVSSCLFSPPPCHRLAAGCLD